MQYAAAILGGIAASAVFWLIDKYLLVLPQSYQLAEMVACLAVFGGAGYWLASRVRPAAPKPGMRIVSGVRAKNVKARVKGVRTGGTGRTEIFTDIDAGGNVDADVENVETKS
jgi:hypothetical protein